MRRILIVVVLACLIVGWSAGVALATQGETYGGGSETGTVTMSVSGGNTYQWGYWKFHGQIGGTTRFTVPTGANPVNITHSLVLPGIGEIFYTDPNYGGLCPVWGWSPGGGYQTWDATSTALTVDWDLAGNQREIDLWATTNTLAEAETAWANGRWALLYSDGSYAVASHQVEIPTPEHPFMDIRIISISNAIGGYLVTVTGYGFLASEGTLTVKDSSTTPQADFHPDAWHWDDTQLDFFLPMEVSTGGKVLRVTNTAAEWDEASFNVGGDPYGNEEGSIFSGLNPLDITGYLKRIFWPTQDHSSDPAMLVQIAKSRFPFTLITTLEAVRAELALQEGDTESSIEFSMFNHQYEISPDAMGSGVSSTVMTFMRAMLWLSMLIGMVVRYMPKF